LVWRNPWPFDRVKKGLIITVLAIVGAITAIGLAIAALIEIVEALLALFVWGIVIGIAYFKFKD